VTSLHADLLTVLDHVQVVAPNRYVVQGVTRELPKELVGNDPLLERAVSALAADLYNRLYLRPAEPRAGTTASWVVRRDFLSALSAANHGRGTWTPNWLILRVGVEDVAVTGYGLVFYATHQQVRAVDGAIEPGKRCWLRVPKELRLLHPGSYYALGNTPDEHMHTDPSGGPRPLLRYFWHLSEDFATIFIKAVTTEFNEREIPFRLKVQSNPADYGRADGGVLYLRREDALAQRDTIALIYRCVGPGLRPDVPLLTFKLADGLSLAEDPGDDSSFGMHRCTLIARALWQSFLQGETDVDSLARTLATVFREQGLDPRHPYLSPGTKLDDLRSVLASLAPESSPVALGPGISIKARPIETSSLSPLEAAAIIGRTICQSAVWDREQRLCNWVSSTAIQDADARPFSPVPAALGPDLYRGSAGVALFLAELHALTGDEDCRRTALAAMARSIRQADRRPGDLASPLSLYCGLLGVAFCSHRVGLVTGEPGLVNQASAMVERLHETLGSPYPLDLLGGAAGAILVLLELGRCSGRNSELDLAVALGDELCRTAERRGAICTWHPDRASGPGVAKVPLTGHSHGASGIALALMTLFQATGRTEFLETAWGAFAYEDSLFDADAGNWPDLCSGNDADAMPGKPRFAGGWCHGAPGIALARLSAMSVDSGHGASHRRSALAAIGTTLQIMDGKLVIPGHDLSLCHGLAGLLDVVLIAGQHLADQAYLDQANSAAQDLIAREGLAVDRPDGATAFGINPSLMLGLAGTGHSLLRLHAPDRVPSVLLLGETCPQPARLAQA
jgi:hypothetical protein